MPLRMEVGLGPGNFVFDGDTAPPRKKGHSPHPILAHVCCDQTAGWIKIPLGTEVNLDPGKLCYMGSQLPPPKRGTSPSFRPMSVVAKRLDG